MIKPEYNYKETQFIINMIRDACNKELIIVSLFLLPILLGAWSIFLNSFSFLDRYDGWKFLFVCILLLLYVLGIIRMKFTDTPEDKLRRARKHVETRLKKRRGHRASFDAIRNEVNTTYTDEFLEKLINMNPEIFGKCKIKARMGNKENKENKEGITLV